MNLSKLVALVAGFLFAFGLGFGELTRPDRVIGLLDITGKWDPTMLIIMLVSSFIYFLGYQTIKGKKNSLLGNPLQIPTNKTIDKKLVVGASIFGVGWGLAGICPGPAVTALASLQTPFMIYFAAMVAGMYAFVLFDRWVLSRPASLQSRGL